MNTKKIVNFIFELGQLKKQAHTGFLLAGVVQPTSVAEHAFRAAQIGYILAELEGVNPEKVAMMVIIHDNVETRTGDPNKINSRYNNNKKESEKMAINEQLDGLSDFIKKKWLVYFEEFEERNTPEGVVAKDADWLEMAFQAKEYYDLGYRTAMDWIDNVEKAVETKSAKAIIAEMRKTEFTEWWQGLKKMTYTKLKK